MIITWHSTDFLNFNNHLQWSQNRDSIQFSYNLNFYWIRNAVRRQRIIGASTTYNNYENEVVELSTSFYGQFLLLSVCLKLQL